MGLIEGHRLLTRPRGLGGKDVGMKDGLEE